MRIAAQRYPQLRQVFLSPRTYAGYATTTLNPEPYAYESGFADRALIMGSVASPTARPWIGWGPYLWTDGTRGRSDGLTWTCADVRDSDGTHPSALGQQKVAQLLQRFFDTSPFAGWYRGSGVAVTASPAPTPTAGRRVRPSPGPVVDTTQAPDIAMPTSTPDTSLFAGIEDLAEDRPVIVVAAAFLVLAVSTALIARMRKA